MCMRIITKKVAGKCKHFIEELPVLMQCDEAKNRGSNCEGGGIKDECLGQSIAKEYCPDC